MVHLRAGGGKIIRYTPDTRPPWLPMDLAWEAALFAKAQVRQLTLFYQHSARELRQLLQEDIRRSERLH